MRLDIYYQSQFSYAYRVFYLVLRDIILKLTNFIFKAFFESFSKTYEERF